MRLIGWLLCRLSAAAARRVGAMLAWLVFGVLRLRRRVCMANLQRAFPALDGSARRNLARSVYRHLAQVVVDVLRLPRLNLPEAQALLGEAAERLDELRSPHGLLVLVGHLGSWDLLACAAGRAGLPLHVVTRRIKRVGIDAHWQRMRAACGVTLHPAEGSALALLRALRRSEIVALPLDQHEPDGFAATFFDRPAATSTALARLARATRAPVVAAFLLRDGDGYRLEVEGPLAFHDDVEVGTQAYTAVLEAAIRRCPEQWLWLHRRWKLGDVEASSP